MARTYEETIYDATVDAVNDALAQPVLPTPDEIKGNILDNSRNEVTMYNSIAQQGRSGRFQWSWKHTRLRILCCMCIISH